MAACAIFESFLKASAKLSAALWKLLPHLRHAAIVEAHRVGVEPRLGPIR
jgi:hypothetical protein